MREDLEDQLGRESRFVGSICGENCEEDAVGISGSPGVLKRRIRPIGHRLRLNEYILYVFGQTRRPLAVSRAKICPGSRPEVPSTPSI